ncbi:MAG: hypothetical protein H0W90_01380 [Actinobacteria bacterium]|nr:hypothetical protein [Actinomycetota bacterium]
MKGLEVRVKIAISIGVQPSARRVTTCLNVACRIGESVAKSSGVIVAAGGRVEREDAGLRRPDVLVRLPGPFRSSKPLALVVDKPHFDSDPGGRFERRPPVDVEVAAEFPDLGDKEGFGVFSFMRR